MNTNKITIYFSLIVIILIVGACTFFKVVDNHNKKLFEVSERRIIEAYQKCINEGKCFGKTTLKTLYDNNYLEIESNPVTKEIYNEDSYVDFQNNEYKFKIID